MTMEQNKMTRNYVAAYLANLNKKEASFLIGDVFQEVGHPHTQLNFLIETVFDTCKKDFKKETKDLIVGALVENFSVKALVHFLNCRCDYVLSNDVYQKILNMTFIDESDEVPDNLQILEGLVKGGDLNKTNLCHLVSVPYECEELSKTIGDQVTLCTALWIYYIHRLNERECRPFGGVDFYRKEMKRILSPIGWVESEEIVSLYDYAEEKERRLDAYVPVEPFEFTPDTYEDMLTRLFTNATPLKDDDPLLLELFKGRFCFWLKYVQPVQEITDDESPIIIEHFVTSCNMSLTELCQMFLSVDENALSCEGEISSVLTELLSECTVEDINFYIDIGFINKDRVGNIYVKGNVFDVVEKSDVIKDWNHSKEISLLKQRLEQLSNEPAVTQQSKKLKK